tara:strand:+ start:488 stop:1519 length:1032 start_codon:yes stop_codon:yes gene_type:complete
VKKNVNSRKTRKHRGGVMSHPVIQKIVSKLELDELEKYYFINKKYKGAIDQKVRGLYRDNYGDDPFDGMSIKEIITKIKIATISSFPPNNGATMLHIDGDFGHPDEPLDSEKLFKLRIKLIPIQKISTMINMIFTDYFMLKYDFDYEAFLKTPDDPVEITQQPIYKQPIYKDFQNTFKDMEDGDKERFFSFFKSDDFQYDQKEMIEKLALIKDSEDLEVFVDEFEDKDYDTEVIEVIQDEIDYIIDKSDSDILTSHIKKTLIDDDKYRIGDFFFRYNYHNPSRQSYGLCTVGYDLKKNNKTLICDGEGAPDIPNWIIKELARRNITWKNHAYDTDEFGAYLNS